MRTLPVSLVYIAAALSLTACGGAAQEAPATVAVTAPPPASSSAAQAGATPTAPVTQVTIPDVEEGSNGAIVLEHLEKAGLTNVQPASQDEEDKLVLNPANWSVVSIDPGAGTEVSSDSTVVVTMTKQ